MACGADYRIQRESICEEGDAQGLLVRHARFAGADSALRRPGPFHQPPGKFLQRRDHGCRGLLGDLRTAAGPAPVIPLEMEEQAKIEEGRHEHDAADKQAGLPEQGFHSCSAFTRSRRGACNFSSSRRMDS